MSVTEEAVNGDALVEMQNEDLKDIGISSMGHRLTVLKAVYEIKIKQNIPIDPNHYVPLCMCSRVDPSPDLYILLTRDQLPRVMPTT